MKKLALLALVTVSLLATFSSCERKSCYQCTTTVTVMSTDTVSNSAKKDYCDITDDRAKEIAEAGSQTSVNTINGVVVTTVTSTTCK